VNVYAFTGVPSASELERLGVARVSVGCGPMQAALGLTRRIAAELRERGTYASLSDGALSVGELNALMTVDRPGAS
jgi:2-methylisocitrate lyase-like PEP mutase family enzyme